MIGPELGVTQPGMTIVCGDSHTATHGAFGALAFGIGTSEVEHVLATQTLAQNKPKSMRITFEGDEMPAGVTAKDLILATIGQMGVAGGTGHVIEFAGPVIEKPLDGGPHDHLQHDHRGRRPRRHDRPRRGHVRVPEGPPRRAPGRRLGRRGRALEHAAHRRRRHIRQGDHGRRGLHLADGHLGHDPGPGGRRGRARVPEPSSDQERRALEYMALEPGTPMHEIRPDRVFIGSCTNSRIGDLREAAGVIEGRQVADGVIAMVVPGSAQVKEQAEAEGLDEVFRSAGFDWRGAGCSMCLGMNPDVAAPGERVASTSNRNFEGRQGKGARSHLMSPRMAAAAAIEGHFVDIRDWS